MGATPWGPRPNFADARIREYIAASVAMLIDDFHISAFRWDSTSCIRQTGSRVGDGACDTDSAAGWLAMQQANALAHGPARAGAWVVAEDTWGAPRHGRKAVLTHSSVPWTESHSHK